MTRPARIVSLSLAVAIALADPAAAQHEGHEGHVMPDTAKARPAPRRTTRISKQPTRGRAHSTPARRPPVRPAPSRRAASPPAPAHGHPIDHAAHQHHGMAALLGPYGMAREGSGTSWQPEASPHRALHAMRGPWHAMLHGAVQVVGTRQGGERGGDDLYANQMLMGMAARPVGSARLGLRGMLSLEPATIGRNGYPLLLQTGETGDGVEHLIDRQHPHDFFMELAATFSVSAGNRSAFLYAALSGEPALGPPVFMHRFSGETFPEAPITHHWLDSSHITFGVLTGGVTWAAFKLDASAFRGREPDQHRWNLERPKLDSHAFRLSWNPAPNWAMQVSHGRLESPEQIEPDLDVDRTTASAMHHYQRRDVFLQTVIAWGRNDLVPGDELDAWLLESTLELRDRHRWFARVERVEKNELFEESDSRAGMVFTVAKLGLGYAYEGWSAGPFRWGLGAFGTMSIVPNAIQDVYGNEPISGAAFVQGRLR